MAYFGTDGDTSAGIIPAASPTAGAYNVVAQNRMVLCGGTAAEGGTPTHVSIHATSASGANNGYIAVYKGGTSSSPDGATLIGTTANITADWSSGGPWFTYALSSTASFATSDYIWIAFLNRKADNFVMRPNSTNDVSGNYRGDWLLKTGGGTYQYYYTIDSVTGTTPPATCPGGGSYSAIENAPWLAYITYTAGASAVAAIAGVSPSSFLDGQMSISITGTDFGAVEGTVIISPTDDSTDVNAVTQTVTSWADTAIVFTAARSTLALATTLYLFVIPGTNDPNTSGYSVQFTSLITLMGQAVF